MKLQIKRVDNTLPLPTYQTSGSVAFDVYARLDVEIPPQTTEYIPINLIIKIPDGYFIMLVPRSSTAKRLGVIFPSGAGIVDQDFHGPNDEIRLTLFNWQSQSVKISRGERIGQCLLIPVQKVELEEATTDFKTESRGGFGSTGH